ncbi:MAG: cold-shock protein [Candidatus Heimdallarchaeaceae archaeon]
MKGTIKRIMYDRNFGFIQVDGEEKDIFFHRSGVTVEFGDLREGDAVEFELEDTDRGQQAINLKTA